MRFPFSTKYIPVQLKVFLYIILALLFNSCKTDYQNLEAFSSNKQLQVVITTPAGSNQTQKYDAVKKEFVPVQEAGLAERISFLPYPGNYGFIPSTNFLSDSLADSQPLEVLVLAESQAMGTVMEVIPITTLVLDISGEVKYIIIAIPSRPSEQTITAQAYATFTKEYPAAKDIIQKWFVNAKPEQHARVMAWKDDVYTDKLIREWLK